jgi:hypothetical protein
MGDQYQMAVSDLGETMSLSPLRVPVLHVPP